MPHRFVFLLWHSCAHIWAFAFAVVCLCGASLAATADVGHIVRASGNTVEQTAVMVVRLSDGQSWQSNPARSQRRFSPASTSKIPHSLIALEAGLAAPSTIFEWDGVPRFIRAWNKDHSLASAFQNSVVWVYQRIAETAGTSVMSKWLAHFEYGNMDVGTPDRLTSYWLDNTLRISVIEQIEFLTRLSRYELSLSDATYAAARDLMISDEDANWVMRSKTGWFHSDVEMDIGWHVGWLECPEETYVFALNTDMPDTRYLSRRKAITYAVLREAGAFDCF